MRLLVSWLLLIDAVISIQKWKEQPHSIEAYEGKDTLLTCKVYNKVRAILRNRKIFTKIARLANVFVGKCDFSAHNERGKELSLHEQWMT